MKPGNENNNFALEIEKQSEKTQNLQSKVDELTKKDRITLIVSCLALVVSVASAFSAGTSAYFNYQTNVRDAFYKELSFRPSILDVYDGGSLEFGVVNRGPGAAEVKKLVIWNETNCLDSEIGSGWAQIQFDHGRAMATSYNNIVNSLLPTELQYERFLNVRFHMQVVENGTIFPSGSRNLLFKISATPTISDADIEAKVGRKFDFEAVKMHAFALLMEKQHFSLEYCSLSGITCDYMEFRKSKANLLRKKC